jgi:hypothetical protein
VATESQTDMNTACSRGKNSKCRQIEDETLTGHNIMLSKCSVLINMVANVYRNELNPFMQLVLHVYPNKLKLSKFYDVKENLNVSIIFRKSPRY